jgi:hypothetical protein
VSRKTENVGFICANCEKHVIPVTNGSYRNHCPYCLYSMHVDKLPGDRANPCCGLMIPVGVVFHTKKGYQIIHRCLNCGIERMNIIALDTLMPDNFDLIIWLSRNRYN